jgi:predicted dehydrogenase
MTKTTIERRRFIKQAALAGATIGITSYSANRVLGANDRIRIGIIGCGDRGQEDLREILKIPNVDFVAAADVYNRRHEQARKLAPAVKTFTDHRRLLDLKDVDAVIVASPLHCHARHFIDTIAAGKDLYSEKTMTWSIEEAEACRNAARKSDRIVQIGLQHESSGPVADTRQWIKSGMAGKITHVESWMSRNTPKGKGQWVRPVPSDCTADNVDWNLFLNGRRARPFDPYKFINWRLFWEFSGGNVTENMVHQIALIISTLDLSLPTSAYMSGGVFSEKDGREVPDTIAVTLDFPNELTVTWQSTFSNSHYGLGERFLGSDGTVERIAGATDMVTGKSQTAVWYFPEKLNRPEGAAAQGVSKGVNHMANFIECIRSRKEPNAPVEIGYRSAVAAHMANLAYQKRERITLDTIRRAPMTA